MDTKAYACATETVALGAHENPESGEGVALKTAIQHVSSNSYWHMVRTPALQQSASTRGSKRKVWSA
ncbi:MAG: hypothetical protein KF778_12720 [Rhodocyclaceae bacterium]|nr:hypothetical protein [Rhodocyclaceae bacterium]